MIYIVSGIHRSGTSMMMKVLVEGGIKPFWSKRREKDMHSRDSEYEINPDKFYEVGQKEYMRLGFTSELPDECCVKIQAIGLPILSACKGYKIIYMRRNPEVIKASYEASFPRDNFMKMYPTWPGYYWQLLDGVKGIMEARKDVDLLELNYDDVLENPEKVIDKLIAFDFPINKKKALSVINPGLRRFMA